MADGRDAEGRTAQAVELGAHSGLGPGLPRLLRGNHHTRPNEWAADPPLYGIQSAGGAEERPKQPKRREARGVHNDDFGIGRELVQRVRDRDHQRDRRDDQDQRWNDEAGDAKKRQDGLTLARHQVDAAQRLGNPDHTGEADQDQRKRR